MQHRLKILRERQGLSQAGLSAKAMEQVIDLSLEQIRCLEQSGTNAGLELLGKCAGALEVDIAILVSASADDALAGSPPIIKDVFIEIVGLISRINRENRLKFFDSAFAEFAYNAYCARVADQDDNT
jgi:transcriptional regulator with XRE-family HTH domain